MALSDTKIKNAKPKPDKAYKLYHEKGLFMVIAKNGGKWWRFKYMFWGKEKLLSLGTYPEISLKLACARRDEARAKVAQGIDPGVARKIEKAGSTKNTFKAVAEEFLEANTAKWSTSHKRQPCTVSYASSRISLRNNVRRAFTDVIGPRTQGMSTATCLMRRKKSPGSSSSNSCS